MSMRDVNRRRLKQYAIGDMRNRITLHTRSLRPGGFGSASFSESYVSVATVWASVSTLSQGAIMFSDVNVPPDDPTHKFIIRYRSDITTENIIEFDGNYFEITKAPIDPDERKQYLELRARLMGDKAKAANT